MVSENEIQMIHLSQDEADEVSGVGGIKWA